LGKHSLEFGEGKGFWIYSLNARRVFYVWRLIDALRAGCSMPERAVHIQKCSREKMGIRKKSLSISRFVFLIGMPIIWLIAFANIAIQYMNMQNIADIAGKVGESGTTDLKSLFGVTSPENLAFQAFATNAGYTFALAMISTALLAMAISAIDMRNLQAMRTLRRS